MCADVFLVCWTPYFFSLLDAWGKRNHPNLLILFYEDMKKVIYIYLNSIYFDLIILVLLLGFAESNREDGHVP